MNEHQLEKNRSLLRKPEYRSRLQTLRALTGSTRFQILILLQTRSDGITVTELAKTLRGSLSRISHQMRILRRHQIVTSKRRQREIIYRIRNRKLLDQIM